MDVKYTKHFLNKLEDIFSETDYALRYERGNFKSGYCILKDTKVAVINKFYSLEGKINCIVDILREIDPNTEKMTPKNKKVLDDIRKTEVRS